METTYLKRKIDDFLPAWRARDSHFPLIVKGARQVGKTEAIRNFARRSYESFIEINFVERPEFKGIIQNGYGASEVVKAISLIDPSCRFITGKTLIFFDEIQEFPDIATTFKFFKQDGRFDVIASGSLLGIHCKHIRSIAVGFQEDYTLRSFDFEEFMRARGYDDAFFDDIFSHMADKRPFSELEHQVLSSRFLDFCVIGGMPRVVGEFIEKGSFENSLALQRKILHDYRDDVRKYATGVDQTRILNVFDHIAPRLAQENKKFQITKVAKGARFADYRGCIEWLEDAGVVNVCHSMTHPSLPIKGHYDESKFKLYMADSGLLVSMLDDEAQMNLRARADLGIYKGGLYENIVAEALRKLEYQLVFYKRVDSTLEEDFFVRNDTDLIPVEVKASDGRAQSLKTLISSEAYKDIRWGIKLHSGNIGWANNVLALPYYLTFLLRKYIASCDPLDRPAPQAPAEPLDDPWLGKVDR
ncbi:MAG: ATP-binding protein [Kiritimatiellae bacterium]|nr:ATP-binding protein [Kiritimatiellia bacterium]